jgi:hypothetical protein
VPTFDFCGLLRTAQAQVNFQIDAARVAILEFVPADQRAEILARIEEVRIQANSQINEILAARCTPPTP